MPHFGAGLLGCEHPIDAGSGGISLLLPGGGLGDETRVAFDAAVKALAGEDADLDLDHVEPARMLGDVVELEAAHYLGYLNLAPGALGIEEYEQVAVPLRRYSQS